MKTIITNIPANDNALQKVYLMSVDKQGQHPQAKYLKMMDKHAIKEEQYMRVRFDNIGYADMRFLNPEKEENDGYLIVSYKEFMGIQKKKLRKRFN